MRAMKKLLERVKSLHVGYESMDEFFQDNPGAVEAVHEWITDNFPKKKYTVMVEFTGTVKVEVEAVSEEEAKDLAEEEWQDNIDDADLEIESSSAVAKE